MVWAGDTPMISITDFAIPGLGDEFGLESCFTTIVMPALGTMGVRWHDVGTIEPLAGQ
ncbi:MAG: hypothetical protein CM1200mP25_4180 [Acidobacteriota bacterium]|nr:MAG: hypothetical protein CM1200mP25_4180 [Acidobacteriota bacterium]